jgi:hypothetical protein
LQYFDAKVLEQNPSLMSGESTPSYLLQSDIVIPRILSVCPWVKIIIILRNPIERAYSQYVMCTDLSGTPAQMAVRGLSNYIGQTFEQAVEEEFKFLADCNITVSRHASVDLLEY